MQRNVRPDDQVVPRQARHWSFSRGSAAFERYGGLDDINYAGLVSAASRICRNLDDFETAIEYGERAFRSAVPCSSEQQLRGCQLTAMLAVAGRFREAEERLDEIEDLIKGVCGEAPDLAALEGFRSQLRGAQQNPAAEWVAKWVKDQREKLAAQDHEQL